MLFLLLVIIFTIEKKKFYLSEINAIMVTSRVSSTSRIGALNKMKKMLVIICNTAQRVQNFVQNSLKNKKNVLFTLDIRHLLEN